MKTLPNPTLLLFLLAGLTAMTPLAIDAYLPAIPTIAEMFGVSVHDVELTISLYLAGYATGQLLGGPFSDHFGRRCGMFTGLVLFITGTLGIVFSTSIEMLWFFRVTQALGGGIAVVNPGAIIRDVSQGKQSARYFAHMAVIMMIAPLVAPLIGVLILGFAGWEAIFVFLLVYALLIATAIYRVVPETRLVPEQRIGTLRRYLMVLSNRYAMGFLFSTSAGSGALFAFITASPSVYMGYFGVSENLYPFLFGANVLTLILINRINVFLIRYQQVSRLISVGQFVQVVASMGLFLHCWLSDQPLLSVVVGLVMLTLGAQSLIISNANASAIEFFPTNSGTAAALLGASGFIIGAFTGLLVALLSDGTPFVMAAVMFGSTTAGPILRYLFQRKGPQEQTVDSMA